jgi:predicted transcriptional regulator
MNFFQMPNSLWDREDLNVYERAVFVHIIRKTIGWGKQKDGISLNQFTKTLNISKPKVISSIKSLIEKELIIKENIFLDNGAKSYNIYGLNPIIIEKANSENVVNDIYKGSNSHLQGVVNDIYKGSNSHLQGVVNDIDIQKTTITKDNRTKETNTINNKTKKEKNIKKSTHTKLKNDKTFELMQKLNVDDNFIKEVIEYRKAIKKPIVTAYALNLFLNSVLKVVETYKVNPEEVFEFIAGKQWQSINHSWDEVKNEFGINTKVIGTKTKKDEHQGLDLSKFGFDKPTNDVIDVNLVGGF